MKSTNNTPNTKSKVEKKLKRNEEKKTVLGTTRRRREKENTYQLCWTRFNLIVNFVLLQHTEQAKQVNQGQVNGRENGTKWE